MLIEQNIPHNLFGLRRPSFSGTNNLVTVFLFPRKPAIGEVYLKTTLNFIFHMLGVKAFYDTGHGIPPFFVAASEIGGFLPIIGYYNLY